MSVLIQGVISSIQASWYVGTLEKSVGKLSSRMPWSCHRYFVFFILSCTLPRNSALSIKSCCSSTNTWTWILHLFYPCSALFLLVIGTAYLEAQGIWEPFRRRLSFEASNPPFDVGRPFDLRRIVGISSEGKYVHLLEINSLICIDLADVIKRKNKFLLFVFARGKYYDTLCVTLSF